MPAAMELSFGPFDGAVQIHARRGTLRNILAKANRRVLEHFAKSIVVLAFDYDGTLAPIVADRNRAYMRPVTRTLLEQLARRYPCTIISGRARRDVSRLLAGIQVSCIVGNHGLEWGRPSPDSERIAREVRKWRPMLEERLATFRGVTIEDKRFSLTIHFRKSPEKRKAVAAIHKTVRSFGNVRVVGGNHVVNVLPSGTPHKGAALERARTMLGCDTAIYVGDDVTDEDVFALNRPEQLLTIRVGASRQSLASYCIRSQEEMDKLLGVLLVLNQKPE